MIIIKTSINVVIIDLIVFPVAASYKNITISYSESAVIAVKSFILTKNIVPSVVVIACFTRTVCAALTLLSADI